jgi:lysylphosphatidylglycerol synthetase-like protein (DUF2156 family)
MTTSTTTTAATATATATAAAPVATAAAVTLPCWYPKCCGKPIFRGNREALGYMHSISCHVPRRLPVPGAFLLPALLNLAKLKAGCSVDISTTTTTTTPCDGKVHGIRPLSLLTTILTLVGVVSAALLPVMGEPWSMRHRIDVSWVRNSRGHTLCAINSNHLGSMNTIGFAMAIVSIILSFVAWMQAMINYADRLPELTARSKSFSMSIHTCGIFPSCLFSFIVIFLATIVAVSAGLDLMKDDYVTVARISQSMTFRLLSCRFCSIVSYGFLYGPRPRGT